MRELSMNGLEVAYVLFRFPQLTETFVAEEIRQVQSLGVQVRIFSLLPARRELVHPLSAELSPLVRYVPEVYAPSLWCAQLYYLLRTPGRFFKLLRTLLGQPAPGISTIPKRVVIFLKGVWLARELEDSTVQLVHTHFAWLSAAACMIVSTLLDLPYTTTTHAYDIYSRKNDLLELTVRTADRIVTISEYNKRTILEMTSPSNEQNIDVIRCGIDLGHFHVTDRRPNSRAFQMTSVGSLIEKKGHEYLIRACRELDAQGVDFRCVIVGGGELRAQLLALIRELGLEDRVVLAGTQTQTWVRDRLSQSDLFALACVVAPGGERDGIPVAIMEALAMEVPVVSTPVSGIPELVQHEVTGLLVPERDAKALSAAITRLAGDKRLRRQLAESGRALVEREYDIWENAAQLTSLFRSVVEERRR
jgi:glycosyltransferase involved in cell wall biosynthesis